MSAPTIINLTIRRGRTWREVVRWETEPYRYAAIATIDNAGPVRITTKAPHDIPEGWRLAVVDALGMVELNAQSNPPKDKDYRRATVVNSSAIEINPLSSAQFGRHQGGTGYLQWFTPHDLRDYEARMAIRDRVGGELLMLLTTVPEGGLAVDDIGKTVTLRLGPGATEAIAWVSGVYELELESPAGDVYAVLAGTVTVEQEVTTPVT